MGESRLYLVSWATLPAGGQRAGCAVAALCRASSRMKAIGLMRGRSLSGVSTREVERLSSQRALELDAPPVSDGEVFVRDCDWGEWSRLD